MNTAQMVKVIGIIQWRLNPETMAHFGNNEIDADTMRRTMDLVIGAHRDDRIEQPAQLIYRAQSLAETAGFNCLASQIGECF